MTTEEQLRAALLGGGRFTGIIVNARGSLRSVDKESISQRTLQTPQQSSSILTEVSIPFTAPVSDRAVFGRQGPGRVTFQEFRIKGGAILLESQASQWESMRRNVFNRLETLFVFRENALVKSFLEKNFFLTPLLLQASEKIREFFGSVIVVLEVSTDPDDGNEQELWARVQTRTTPEIALSTLTAFDQEWWLDASSFSRNLLNIKLEYV